MTGNQTMSPRLATQSDLRGCVADRQPIAAEAGQPNPESTSNQIAAGNGGGGWGGWGASRLAGNRDQHCAAAQVRLLVFSLVGNCRVLPLRIVSARVPLGVSEPAGTAPAVRRYNKNMNECPRGDRFPRRSLTTRSPGPVTFHLWLIYPLGKESGSPPIALRDRRHDPAELRSVRPRWPTRRPTCYSRFGLASGVGVASTSSPLHSIYAFRAISKHIRSLLRAAFSLRFPRSHITLPFAGSTILSPRNSFSRGRAIPAPFGKPLRPDGTTT